MDMNYASVDWQRDSLVALFDQTPLWADTCSFVVACNTNTMQRDRYTDRYRAIDKGMEDSGD